MRKFEIDISLCALHKGAGNVLGFTSTHRGQVEFKMYGCPFCIDEIIRSLLNTAKLPETFKKYVKEVV